MKSNLNSHVIGSLHFLETIGARYNIITRYDDRMYSDVNTYLAPYCYIKQYIPQKDWESFKVFYQQLLYKSDMSLECIDDIFETTDISLVYTFIVAAQYYFL